ncbi:MAG: TAXI family TRAP transporter solute-binding subunit [Alphaproteobacteria bacterium]|jgi:TRAP transporter TAXI family solute receptor
MTKIRITSSDLLSTFYTQARDIGAVLVEEGLATEVEVMESTGSVMNAERTVTGDAEIGFMASNWVPRAVSGSAPFTAPVPVAIATPLNTGPLFFVCPEGSPLKAFSDLKGKRIAVGHADSGMAQHAYNFVRTLGWGDDGVEFSFISTFDGGNALASGEIDAQLQAPIPSTHFKALCDMMPIKVLAFSDDEIKTLCDAIPFYFPANIPAEHVPTMDKDIATVGVLNVIVTAADCDPDFVHDFVAACIRHTDDLATRNALFRGLTALLQGARVKGQDALAPDNTPLHPGALAAFREAGLLS